MTRSPLALLFLALSTGLAAQTPDWPKRKPGLWEMQMESAQMPTGPMAMSQCIDAATDAAMQQRAAQGDQKNCETRSFKRLGNGWESRVVCKTERGSMDMLAIASGDFTRAYQIDTTVRMNPPQQGMSEMKSVMKVRHAGACPGDMKPGDMRVNGLRIPAGMGSEGGRMSKEDMQKMLEQMKKQMGQ